MSQRSIALDGVDVRWDTERGTMSFFGIPASTFWLNPSLLRILAPLRDEVGNELFSLLVAHSSSLGTDEDYHTMVTVLGETFQEGFLAWGRAVGAAGWGSFELPHFDRETGKATVIIRSPWELVMQEGLEEPWGCPFLRGKMIGLFTHALGQRCWANERGYRDGPENVVEISIFPSEKTIAEELDRLRGELARRRARELEEKVERLAAQLQQAQKMEAIGQLTGGIAHDFNNLLTVIQGNVDLIADGVTTDRAKRAMKNALSATQTATTLTRRLLAFSRIQALSPQTVDLRELIAGMDPLLRRSLSETVAVEVISVDDLWPCEVDAAQLESAILNLAINARDALPNGGTIRIEAANAELSAAYAAGHEIASGPYVMLSVSDDGVGMSPDIIEQAFEPFFTTKGVGRGSGLGLSMVYGFVTQSRGHIEISSEIGRGTSVKIYLPCGGDVSVPSKPVVESREEVPRGQQELVLVVEDSAPVRELSVAFLQRLGYATIDVEGGRAALEALRDTPSVALVFTDVVLAGGMDGVALARELQAVRPNLPVLFVSGYAETAIVHRGKLDPTTNLLEKPFTEAQLARRVRAALESAHEKAQPTSTPN